MEALLIIGLVTCIIVLFVKVRRLKNSHLEVFQKHSHDIEKFSSEMTRAQSRIDMLSISISNK
jgi:hypothetical protein